LLGSSRSGSLAGPEDLAYTQALIIHQKVRLDKLVQDLTESNCTLGMLRDEVSNVEKDTLQRKRSRSSTFPTGDDLQKIREEHRQLQINIQLMTREFDMYNTQLPLGELNPSFYEHMPPGQRGSIYEQNRSPAPGSDVAVQGQVQEDQPGQRQTHYLPYVAGVPPPRPPPPQYTAHPAPRPPPTSPYVSSQGLPYPAGMVPYPSPVQPRAPLAQREITPPHDPEEEAENWACGACTFSNHSALDKCEMCEMPRVSVAGYS
jgi:hypothetical protein